MWDTGAERPGATSKVPGLQEDGDGSTDVPGPRCGEVTGRMVGKAGVIWGTQM